MSPAGNDPPTPGRDITAAQALLAVAVLFVVGVVIGFVLGRTV